MGYGKIRQGSSDKKQAISGQSTSPQPLSS